MAKLTGILKSDDDPFTGMLIMTALNGTVQQYGIEQGKPKDQIDVKPGFYNVQMVSSESRKSSSYPQYKWRIADAGSVEFDKIEVESLA
jgi:hypothetical protein